MSKGSKSKNIQLEKGENPADFLKRLGNYDKGDTDTAIQFILNNKDEIKQILKNEIGTESLREIPDFRPEVLQTLEELEQDMKGSNIKSNNDEFGYLKDHIKAKHEHVCANIGEKITKAIGLEKGDGIKKIMQKFKKIIPLPGMKDDGKSDKDIQNTHSQMLALFPGNGTLLAFLFTSSLLTPAVVIMSIPVMAVYKACSAIKADAKSYGTVNSLTDSRDLVSVTKEEMNAIKKDNKKVDKKKVISKTLETSYASIVQDEIRGIVNAGKDITEHELGKKLTESALQSPEDLAEKLAEVPGNAEKRFDPHLKAHKKEFPNTDLSDFEQQKKRDELGEIDVSGLRSGTHVEHPTQIKPSHSPLLPTAEGLQPPITPAH